MAYGVTQNFSQPIYSGIFAYRCTFNGKPVSFGSKLRFWPFQRLISLFFTVLEPSIE